MAIWLTERSKVIVQGITGSEGSKHTRRMVAAGTDIVAGTNPRKAGQDFDGLPIYATVGEAVKETGADVAVSFIPPAFAKAAAIEAIEAEIPLLVVITEGIPVHDSTELVNVALRKGTKAAAIEAVDAGVPLVVVITEGIPVHDTAAFFQYAQDKGSTRIIGPNCPGVITPGESLAGITPHTIAGKGPIGLVSKSGTLTYQMMYELRDIGFSTCVGIGSDPVIGTTHIDCLAAFQDDPDTDAIVMIGEIGGDAE